MEVGRPQSSLEGGGDQGGDGGCWIQLKAEPGDSLMVDVESQRGGAQDDAQVSGPSWTQMPRVRNGRQGPHSSNPSPVHARTHTGV